MEVIRQKKTARDLRSFPSSPFPALLDSLVSSTPRLKSVLPAQR